MSGDKNCILYFSISINPSNCFRSRVTDRCGAILSPTKRAQNREGTANHGSRVKNSFSKNLDIPYPPAPRRYKSTNLTNLTIQTNPTTIEVKFTI
jgi:hypothetical protein